MAKENLTVKAKAVALEASTDNNNPQKEQKAKPSRNAFLMPLLVLILFIIISIAAVFAWIELSFSTSNNQKNTEKYQDDLVKSVSGIINNAFSSTQKQLDRIATDVSIQNALILQDQIQLETITTTIANSFSNVISFSIIPWDLTGTAGLKARNIEPRNNIELMLLSQSGSKKTPNAEAYLHNKEWLISFSSPVIKDGQVIGVLLLTFNKNYISDIIRSPAFTDKAMFVISLKNQNQQPVLKIGTGTVSYSNITELAFTDGELTALFDKEHLENLQTSYLPVYIALGCLTLLLILVSFIAHRSCSGLIKKDALAIRNYAESLSGLHKTQQPQLLIPFLSPLLNTIDALNVSSVKTNMTSEIVSNYKSPQAGKVPEKVGVATVNDSNSFDHPEIFRDYDIRGLAEKQLTSDAMVSIGKAIGSQAISLGIKTILTGRDGRLSSEKIQYDLSRGINSTGCNVINLGQIPTPVLYFATHQLEIGAGVMVTGSHNPAEYNGLKIVLDNKPLKGQDIQNLLKRIENYDFVTGEGKTTRQDINSEYVQAISNDIIIAKPLKVVIDACNGVGGEIATELLTMLDCQVTPLFCNVDGNFPNHGPDPSVRANLTDLVNKVREVQADIGIAFDGDADRMVAVTASGEVISGDQLLMLFAKDIVSRNAASNIVYDVKCSRQLEKIITQYGGRAIMTKSGHSNIKAKMQETGALLGGELTGHFFFKERWYGFDDGIYAALRLIELLTTSNNTLDEEIASLPASFTTEELHIPISQPNHSAIAISTLQDILSDQQCKIDTTDGIRAEFDQGWGLLRTSNTSQSLSLRFEAETEEELARIQGLFKMALSNPKLNLTIPF